MSAGAIVVATGSRPREIPGFPFDGKVVLSSTDALMLQRLPRRMLMLGGGAIGVEFAHVLNAFGVEVRLVEMMDRLLPLEDAGSVAVLDKALQPAGRRHRHGDQGRRLETARHRGPGDARRHGGRRTTVEADQVLVVVGRPPNTDGLGLERLGIALERGFIPVGDGYRTAVPSVYAIGDVVATPAARARRVEGRRDRGRAHRGPSPGQARLDPLSIPSGVYCEPQVASFGYTEEKAKAATAGCTRRPCSPTAVRASPWPSSRPRAR